MYKEASIFTACILVLIVGCTIPSNNQEPTIVSDEKKEVPSNPDIKQCKDQYINQFFLDEFGVDVHSKGIKKCEYESLGYGGGYRYNISVTDIQASEYFSGGPGGHGATTYCFSSSDLDSFKIAQSKLCESMKYVTGAKLKEIKPFCGDTPEFDATDKIIQLCKDGLFTYSTSSGKVISYTQYENPCVSLISFGTYDCVSENIDITHNKKILDDAIATFGK